MSRLTRISRVCPCFDFDALNREYVVVRLERRVERRPKPFGYADELFDRLATHADIAAVSFAGGSEAYVLVGNKPGSPSAASVIRDAMGSRPDIAFDGPKSLSSIDTRRILLLCLASIVGDSCSRASNVCGRLLVVSTGKPHMEYFGGTTEPSVIHALEVGVTARLELELKVRTFTSCAARTFAKELSRYELVDGQYLRRVLGAFDPRAKNLFCERVRHEGDRHGRFYYLDASSANEFMHSKLGVLHAVLTCLDDRFGDAVRLNFERVEEVSRTNTKNSKRELRLEQVARGLAGHRICVSDATGALGSEAQVVCERVREQFGLEASVERCVAQDALNLRLVFDAGSYKEGEDDPYACDLGGCIVQHLTPASKFSEDAVAVSVKELAIKLDVCERRMGLFGWDYGTWEFGQWVEGEKGGRLVFVHVGEDGSLEFEGPVAPLFAQGTWQELAQALAWCERAQYVMRGPKGDVNVVSRTELFGVPNFETIWQDLLEPPADRVFKSGKPMIHAIGKGRAARERYFADAVDIATCRAADGTSYYRVGMRGEGMKFDATRNASILREVIPVGDSDLLTQDIVPMLDVDYVRWGMPTVVPFPLKYLREWCAVRASS